MQPLVNRLYFAATVTAPGCARMFVNHTLRSWLLEDLLDNAELIVSELVTNAVQATGITDPNPTYTDLEGLALLAVQLRVAGAALFIEVWDNDSDKPATPPPADKDPDECGRGLAIVQALSKTYGATTLAKGGKIVWAELDAGPEIAAVPQLRPDPLSANCRRDVFSDLRHLPEHAVAQMALMNQITGSRERHIRALSRQAG